MRFISDIHTQKQAEDKPVISLEFFPPKTDEGDRNLLEKTIPALLQFRPDFCSVTYGAGGGTKEKTLKIVDQIQRQHNLTTMAHLTCVGATVAEIGGILQEAKSLGVKNILALRGDPPENKGEFIQTEGGFEYSYQLVRYIKETGGFCIGTAGFPEGHVACTAGKHVDWSHLKAKIDEGADFVITQLFFDNSDFFEFRDYMTKTLGVTIPIYPGIIPILSYRQITRFTALCGAQLPQKLLSDLEELQGDDEKVTEFGIDYATRQCEQLLSERVPGLHFYTLNKANATCRILKNLSLSSSRLSLPEPMNH